MSPSSSHPVGTSADLDASLWPPVSAGPDELDGVPDRRRSDADGGRLLRPEDYLPESVEPPVVGWRHLAWRLGARWISPSARELRHRGWARQARRSFASPKVITVFSPKGGVGKSTTALLLGHVLAELRGDMVVALDANPDSGNLVKRAPEPYSVMSADDLHHHAHRVERYADLVPFLTQVDSGLGVVRSDTGATARLGPQEYQNVLGVLSRFYSVIVVDLGTGMREPAFLSIVEAADAVIAVTRPSFDSAEVLAEGIAWLSARFPEKMTAATVVINAVDSVSGGLDVGRLTREFERRVARVLNVPHDRHLATGGVPHSSLLAKGTQDAYLQLAADIITALPDGPHHVSPSPG